MSWLLEVWMFVVWGVCRAGGVVPSTGVEVLGVEDTCESVILFVSLLVGY